MDLCLFFSRSKSTSSLEHSSAFLRLMTSFFLWALSCRDTFAFCLCAGVIMECSVAFGPSEVLTWSWGFIKNCALKREIVTVGHQYFLIFQVWLYRTHGRVSYSWSTTSCIPLLSNAPRQPMNMNDTFKISSIIILAFFGTVIQRALHLGSC